MISIYESLNSLGIEVKMATHGGPYKFLFDQSNISYDIIGSEITDEFCNRYMQSIYDGGRTQNYTKKELYTHVTSEIDYFKKVSASLVVSGFTLSARLSSKAYDIPLVVTHLGSWTPITFEKYGVEVRECFKNTITQFVPGKWLNKLGNWLFSRSKSYISIFNEVSVELGIRPCNSLFDLLLGDHTLITDVPEILGISEKEVSDWRPINKNLYRSNTRLTYVGSLYARLFGMVPKDVLDFLNTSKPKIYISMNSGPDKFLKEVYQTVVGMDVVVLMVSTLHDVSWVKSTNVLVKRFLPSDKVMPLCDLAIIHGGQGTIQTAIASGVPIIGFPLQPEQNFNLRRIMHLGAGICMALFDLKSKKLKPIIEKILKSPSYRKNAKKLKYLQSQRDGATSTAIYIRNLLYT